MNPIYKVQLQKFYGMLCSFVNNTPGNHLVIISHITYTFVFFLFGLSAV